MLSMLSLLAAPRLLFRPSFFGTVAKDVGSSSLAAVGSFSLDAVVSFSLGTVGSSSLGAVGSSSLGAVGSASQAGVGTLLGSMTALRMAASFLARVSSFLLSLAGAKTCGLRLAISSCFFSSLKVGLRQGAVFFVGSKALAVDERFATSFALE